MLSLSFYLQLYLDQKIAVLLLNSLKLLIFNTNIGIFYLNFTTEICVLIIFILWNVFVL